MKIFSVRKTHCDTICLFRISVYFREKWSEPSCSLVRDRDLRQEGSVLRRTWNALLTPRFKAIRTVLSDPTSLEKRQRSGCFDWFISNPPHELGPPRDCDLAEHPGLPRVMLSTGRRTGPDGVVSEPPYFSLFTDYRTCTPWSCLQKSAGASAAPSTGSTPQCSTTSRCSLTLRPTAT